MCPCAHFRGGRRGGLDLGIVLTLLLLPVGVAAALLASSGWWHLSLCLEVSALDVSFGDHRSGCRVCLTRPFNLS